MYHETLRPAQVLAWGHVGPFAPVWMQSFESVAAYSHAYDRWARCDEYRNLVGDADAHSDDHCYRDTYLHADASATHLYADAHTHASAAHFDADGYAHVGAADGYAKTHQHPGAADGYTKADQHAGAPSTHIHRHAGGDHRLEGRIFQQHLIEPTAGAGT
jgi:hypothetical protein